MDHLRIEEGDAFGRFLPPLLGVRDMNNYFYIDSSYQMIKSDTYLQEGLHTMQ